MTAEGSGRTLACPDCEYTTRVWDADPDAACPECEYPELVSPDACAAIRRDRERRTDGEGLTLNGPAGPPEQYPVALVVQKDDREYRYVGEPESLREQDMVDGSNRRFINLDLIAEDTVLRAVTDND